MWGDGELRKKPLFGDIFAMRTDYSSGTFYRGRMQFLAEGKDDNILEPPAIFKTKRQAKNALREKEVVIQKLSFPKKEIEESVQVKSISKKVAEGNKKQIQKRQNHQHQAVVYLPVIADVKKEDWIQSHQAGCRMWVNHVTGDVMSECPWGKEAKGEGEETDNGLRVNDVGEQAPDEHESKGNDFSGTGSLVYDPNDLNTLLSYFDAIPKK